MAWSTREIAELADTSLRAVRHYHQVGLLEEPERHSNGYKQYGVAHLIRLLQVKHLAGLGFSLPQIAAMGDTNQHPAEALRALDAELAATLTRLQQARVELDVMLRQATPTELPPEIAGAAAGAALSDPDRSFVVVLARLLGPRGLEIYAQLLANLPAAADASQFDDLPIAADEGTRQDAAEQLATYARVLRAAHPDIGKLLLDAPRGPSFTEQTLAEAMTELYTVAQLDVMRRTNVLLGAAPTAAYLWGRNIN